MSTKVAILAIGDELVSGATVDRNSAWISARLQAVGLEAIEHRTVPDDVQAIAEAMVSLRSAAGIVIATGGLGPTQDDLTREALAIALVGSPELVEDEAALAALTAWYRGRNRPMPASNRQQALRPRDAVTLPNPHGTAPGLFAAHGGFMTFCLPGPPREMQPMFEAEVQPRLAAAAGGRVVASESVNAFGEGESALAECIADLMERGRDPVVGTAASIRGVTARIRSSGPAAEAAARVEAVAAEIERRWSPYSFARGQVTLPEAVASSILASGCTLAVAESCTAGLLGEMIVSVAGASRFFEGGWMVYSNALKSSQLAVPTAMLEAHGAVSEPVAAALAMSAASRANTDLALSVTGIAGPAGGSEAKPVGTVFIGLCDRRQGPAHVRRFRFPGDRGEVRERTARSALTMLRLHLAGHAATRLLWEVAS